jgi:hypothetical protein
MLFAAITLFTALAIPVRLCAQGKPEHNSNHNHHHYKLIDLGTFVSVILRTPRIV